VVSISCPGPCSPRDWDLPVPHLRWAQGRWDGRRGQGLPAPPKKNAKHGRQPKLDRGQEVLAFYED